VVYTRIVRSHLYVAHNDQIRADLATIDRVYREETGDLGELALRMGTRFEVSEGATVIYRTTGWPPVGAAPFRQSTMADATHRIRVARDEGPVRQTLWTLALIMATAIPCAVGLAVAGGYLLGGRMLPPLGPLAD